MKKNLCFLLIALPAFLFSLNGCKETREEKESFEYAFQNPSLAIEERIDDLIGRLTLEEKVSLMMYDSPAIERLGIPAYNWWNECLHGVARSGPATVFPQAIGMGAT
ncbi:MAG: hypothetical protein ACOC10_11410, partial [Bacteroidota bacterium]